MFALCLIKKIAYSFPKVTYNYPRVTYSDPKVTYSVPKVTHSNPTLLPYLQLPHQTPNWLIQLPLPDPYLSLP